MVNEKDKWIDLSGLPKRKYGKREVIDWELVSNHKVSFSLKDVQGELSVSYSHENDKGKTIVNITYNNQTHSIQASNLVTLKFYKVLKQYGQHGVYNTGDIVNDFLIVDLIKIEVAKQYYHGYILKCLLTGEYIEATHKELKGNLGRTYLVRNWLYAEKHLLQYLKNPEDAKNYTKRSNKQIDCVCPHCSREKKMTVNKLYDRGLTCRYCSTSTSYPEKLMASLLELNDIEFESEKQFSELKGYRYDFYLLESNTIIEMHGIQHYEEASGFYKGHLAKTQKSDLIKKQFCESQNITYIEIDSRVSNMKFILKNVNNSSLEKLLSNQNIVELSRLIEEKSNYKNIEEMISDRENGLSYAEIGKKYGYQPQLANIIIKRNSVIA